MERWGFSVGSLFVLLSFVFYQLVFVNKENTFVEDVSPKYKLQNNSPNHLFVNILACTAEEPNKKLIRHEQIIVRKTNANPTNIVSNTMHNSNINYANHILYPRSRVYIRGLYFRGNQRLVHYLL